MGIPGFRLKATGSHNFKWSTGGLEGDLSVFKKLAGKAGKLSGNKAAGDFLRKELDLIEKAFGKLKGAYVRYAIYCPVEVNLKIKHDVDFTYNLKPGGNLDFIQKLAESQKQAGRDELGDKVIIAICAAIYELFKSNTQSIVDGESLELTIDIDL